jgi:predicted ATPase
MLGWALILHYPILPKLIVIDCPEVDLHISRFPTLSNWIKRAAVDAQVIVATHSPDLLDYFSDSIESIICFSSKGGFQAVGLPLEAVKEKVAEGWHLGDLYRVGDPLIGGWDF